MNSQVEDPWQKLWAQADIIGDPEDDAYRIGLRDGWERAIAYVDQCTGGDGEYRYCTDHDPERHCPDPRVMVQRIVDRIAHQRDLPSAEELAAILIDTRLWRGAWEKACEAERSLPLAQARAILKRLDR